MTSDHLTSQASNSILLFSLPRSGSTWIGKILDSHPATLYRHEPDSVKQIKDVSLFPDPHHFDELSDSFLSFTEQVAQCKAAKVCAKAPIFPKSYLTFNQLMVYRLSAKFSKASELLGGRVPVMGAPTGGTGSRLVWKSIESLGRLGLAMVALPAASGVILMRHPCGYVASVCRGQSQLKFEDNETSGEDYAVFEMLLQTEFGNQTGIDMKALQSMSREERLAWRWALVNTKAIRETEGNRSRCSIISYDKFCERPLEAASELFEWVGLSWSQQTERFIQQSTNKHSKDYYAVMKDPKIAANKWQQEMSPATIDRILAITSQCDAGAYFSD